MKKRVFQSTFLVSMAVLASCLALIVGVLYSYFSNQYVQELKNESVYIAQGMELQGEDYLTGLTTSTRITWIGSEGTVLYDSKADPASMENHSDRKEVQQALSTGTGESVRYSTTLSEQTVNYARLLSDGTVLRVSGNRLSVWALVWGMMQQILMVVAVAIALSGFLAYRTSKRLAEPLRKVDLEHPLESSEDIYDELAPFLTRIEQQNRQIQRQIRDLSKQQEEFEAITSQMDEGLIILDPQANVLSINRRGAEIFGVEQDCIGKHILTLNRSTQITARLKQCLAGEPSQTQFALGEREYQMIATPVAVGEGQTGAVVLLLDITQSHQAEQLRREFSANVSHELKTPLTSISGCAELMQNGLVQPEDMIPFARTIYQEANRLIHLVDDIIRISQLDEEALPDRQEPVELLTLTRQVAERLEPVAAQRKVTLSVSGVPCTVRGIPQVLDEVIYNLCDNAIKYNKEGGSVQIALKEVSRQAVLTVSDTGIGIPYEHQSRVFERFYRVDKSHSKATGGTGLGLSIVKHGVLLHGGQISLESTPGVGTTITLYLPVQASK